MANISWKRGISGQFNDAQDWSSNSVPTSTGGTLKVSNGVDSVNIALLGNYTAAAFTTASDGAIAADHTTGTLILDTGSNPRLLLATAPH
jgi:hypothetical protein